jgi:hypothetical protein
MINIINSAMGINPLFPAEKEKYITGLVIVINLFEVVGLPFVHA